MAFDFPAAPAVDDVYSSSGINYKWNGTAWVFDAGDPVPVPPLQKVQIFRTVTANSPPVGLLPGELAIEMATPTRLWVGVPTSIDLSGKKLLLNTAISGDVVVSETPPASPTQGMQWLESDTLIMWVYYIDPSGAPGQWIQVNGVPTVTGITGGGAGDSYTKAESNGLFVDVAGDTMTGNLTITKTAPALVLNNTNVAAGSIDGVQFQYNGVNRWWLAAAADPVTSANAGSPFTFYGYNDDASAFIVYDISRAGAKLWTHRIPATFTSQAKFTAGTHASNYTNGAVVVTGGLGVSGISYTAGIAVDDTNGATGMTGSISAIGVKYAGAGSAYGISFLPRVSGVSVPLSFSNGGGGGVGSIQTNDTGTTYNTVSDARLKEDLKPIEDVGGIIDRTNVYDFAWKANGERSHGVIAQEAIEVYPQPVTHFEPEDSWGVDYSKYVPILLQEIKNLRVRVAELESKYGGN